MKNSESYVRTLGSAEQGRPSNPSETDAAAVSETQLELRQQAVAADAASDLEVSLALLWRELVLGLWRVADSFFSEDRCYLLLSGNGVGSQLQGRRLEILEAVLCGTGQKNIAMELGLAPSTVALNARLGLEHLGLSCKASRAHPLLMVAAKAGAKHDGTLAASLSSLDVATEQLRVVSMPRPDRRLFRVLPPAELAVIKYLVEGLPYDEIARLRGTATRTIANQITAVFRRMRVSGRNELLTRLFFAESLERAPQPRWTGTPAVAPSSELRPVVSAALRSA